MVKSWKYLDSIPEQVEDDFRLKKKKKITDVFLLNFWMYLIEGVKKLLREDHGSLQMNLKSYCKGYEKGPQFLFAIISPPSFYSLVQLEHFWICWVCILSTPLN